MSDSCEHLDHIHDVDPVATGCVECLRTGGAWMHLRRCTECGNVGCCDQSPNKHATAHFHETAHPIIQSFEQGEDWYYCFVDDFMFEVEGEAASPSHP